MTALQKPVNVILRLVLLLSIFLSQALCGNTEELNRHLLPALDELYPTSRQIFTSKSCSSEALIDLETHQCAIGNKIYFKPEKDIKTFCLKKYSPKYCSQSEWAKQEFIKLQDEYILSLESLEDWLKIVQDRKDIYDVPNSQDIEGQETKVKYKDFCSTYNQEFPFILSHRRQTDSLVKQLYSALPKNTIDQTAFVIPDRLLQCPQKYLEYLKNKKEIIIVGSFYGSGRLNEDGNSTFYEVILHHERALFMLKATLALAKLFKLQVKNVFYSMGDSSTPLGQGLKKSLEGRYKKILQMANYRGKINPISWGADELVPLAFASSLNPLTAYVEISNPSAKQFHDGNEKADKLLTLKLKEANLSRTSNPQTADLIFYIYTRRTDEYNDDFSPNDILQNLLDHSFKWRIENQSEKLFSKTSIVDARIFNGAWNELSVPKRCDFLTYSSWGTFSNNLGSSLAIAKILSSSGNRQLQQKMLMEAIYHDAFCNDYQNIQRGDFPKQLLLKTGIQFAHFQGYKDYDSTLKVFDELNTFAGQRFLKHFEESKCLSGKEIRVQPRLWRTFESEVLTLNKENN